MHRDIKPGNILVSKDYCFKLGDFGTSKILKQNEMLHSFIGSLSYMSPE